MFGMSSATKQGVENITELGNRKVKVEVYCMSDNMYKVYVVVHIDGKKISGVSAHDEFVNTLFIRIKEKSGKIRYRGFDETYNMYLKGFIISTICDFSEKWCHNYR